MNKILNWVFGSFFRTLGRLMVFILIGFILAQFINFKDIKLTDLLGLEKVNASVVNNEYAYYTGSTRYPTYYLNRYQGTQAACAAGNLNCTGTFNFNFNANGSAVPKPQNATKVLVPVYARTDVVNTNFIWPHVTNLNLVLKAQNANWITCKLEYNADNIYYFVCDLENNVTGLHGFELTYNSQTVNEYGEESSNVRIYKTYGISINLIYYTEEDKVGQLIQQQQNINSSIQSQTQQQHQDSQNTQNAINNVNDSLTNNNTNDASNSAGSFFDNFNDNDHGLSSIITSPLRAINAMLNDTCVAPGATYKGQSFSLPCGSMLWNREGGQDFRNFINIMYGGFLAYFVIRSLFLDIEKLKNPNNDKVEVESL